MANSFLCGLSDPNPSQVYPVLGETPQGVVAPRGIPDCFFHSSKESLAAFHKPMFSFWVNTLGCAHPPLTKRQILCSHCLSPLFLSHSRAQAGSHFCDLQKNVPPCKDDPLLAEIGWQRTKVAQTKQKSRTKPYSSLLYLTLSSHLILTTLELCESLWNTKSYVGFSVEHLFLGCSESSPMLTDHSPPARKMCTSNGISQEVFAWPNSPIWDSPCKGWAEADAILFSPLLTHVRNSQTPIKSIIPKSWSPTCSPTYQLCTCAEPFFHSFRVTFPLIQTALVSADVSPLEILVFPSAVPEWLVFNQPTKSLEDLRA